MNFQHTEDRRMLADTLNRFIAEQYGFPVRARIASTCAWAFWNWAFGEQQNHGCTKGYRLCR